MNQSIIKPMISKIELKRLFGRYDYELNLPLSESDLMSKVNIIYGDNGTGKTTILGLLFHLLSPADKRGHRTYITRVPFLNCEVSFSDQSKIRIERKTLMDSGYKIILLNGNKKIKEASVPVNENGIVPTDIPELDDLIANFPTCGRPIFFLTEDRVLQSDQFDEVREENSFFMERSIRKDGTIKSFQDARQFVLMQTLHRTSNWLSQKLIRESSRGEAESQQIYALIVNTLNSTGIPKDKDYSVKRQELMMDLKTLEERSKYISKFGLISKINIAPLIAGLNKANNEVLPFVTQVISSFIDGQKVRLDALDKFSKLLDHFVELINGEFLFDKEVYISIQEGIYIKSKSGNVLAPKILSSGEKQLLLLLCNVLMASETTSIFIVDEPELSLNVKWQRRLVDALADITSGSQCQFLFATHSIELLTKHKTQVIRLNPIIN